MCFCFLFFFPIDAVHPFTSGRPGQKVNQSAAWPGSLRSKVGLLLIDRLCMWIELRIKNSVHFLFNSKLTALYRPTSICLFLLLCTAAELHAPDKIRSLINNKYINYLIISEVKIQSLWPGLMFFISSSSIYCLSFPTSINIHTHCVNKTGLLY